MPSLDDERPLTGRYPDRGASSPRVRWDESAARTLHADTFRLEVSREHIGLLFGNPVAVDGQEQVVRPAAHVALSPFAAKRLATALATVVGDYEARFGSLPVAPVGGWASSADAAPEHRLSPQEVAERARLLYRITGDLGVGIGLERSVKVAGGLMLHRRFLLGVSKTALGATADSRLEEACGQMGMPSALLEVLGRYLPFVDYVHFGFEAGGSGIVYKVYLEFWETIQRQMAASAKRPVEALLHLGLKWDVQKPARQAVARYVWYPWISADAILGRVSRLLSAPPDAGLRHAANDLVATALARIGEPEILYLEVSEEGNPRRSFDINVYRADLEVQEVYPLLSALCRRQSVPYDPFHSLYRRIRGKRFGHLAGGIDRMGRPFFTAYYGVGRVSGGRPSSGGADQGAVRAPEASLPSTAESAVRIEETDQQARQLCGLTEGLGLRTGLEHSVKFVDGRPLAGRFVAGVLRPADGGQDAETLDLCAWMGMPDEFLALFAGELPEAQTLFFGLEVSETSRVMKAYVELTERLAAAAAARRSPPEGVVVLTGYKWDISGNGTKSVTQYRAYPSLSAEEISKRVLERFYSDHQGGIYRIVDDMIDLSGTRTQPGELVYLEASEAGNERRSYDIKVYRADLRMAEVYPFLLKAARHFSVDMDRFRDLYEDIKDQVFGHVSGGTDREGRDYLTVYFADRTSSGRLAS